MPLRARYSRWDGTQAGFELDAEDVLSEITDDLLYHGDLNAALRRMMQSGFRDQNGERLAGSETPAAVASAVEFVLEGLHLSKRLNKDAVGTKATYRGRN